MAKTKKGANSNGTDKKTNPQENELVIPNASPAGGNDVNQDLQEAEKIIEDQQAELKKAAKDQADKDAEIQKLREQLAQAKKSQGRQQLDDDFVIDEDGHGKKDGHHHHHHPKAPVDDTTPTEIIFNDKQWGTRDFIEIEVLNGKGEPIKVQKQKNEFIDALKHSSILRSKYQYFFKLAQVKAA